MSGIQSKLARGVLVASLLALSAHVGCGSDSEAPRTCSSGCNAEDASAGSSGTAGTGAQGGSAGTGGTAGAGGSGAGGTAGSGADAAPDAELDATPDANSCGACSAYSQPVSAGNVAQTLLSELSGIVASRSQPGVFFAHNDSGDSARFFAFDSSGRPLAEFRLQGASAADWEDMALGPCPGGSCLFFGDIGDNSEQRAGISILRVAEPILGGADGGASVVTHERFEYRYAPGPQNAEALLADPRTGNLYIVTKNPSGTSLVFRVDAPRSPGSVQTLQTLAELTLPMPGGPLVTGGAVHPCGDRLLLRTYSALFEYVAPAGQPLEAAFATPARPVPAALESQGEAVTYLGDGLGYVTASEGTTPALYVARCQ